MSDEERDNLVKSQTEYFVDDSSSRPSYSFENEVSFVSEDIYRWVLTRHEQWLMVV